ncbi:glycoside hydrolase family protein [Undibacterium curvum]|uniref:Lysozyme n=1 Tax=Undibacterium curvum TaxID=2762294 RepID=A0ABR7A4X9_9BURK|nr:glycoside hydrolase family protein [Undibacterium curvum]MBC3931967.1 glycoside hydrolase family protein [Undibacterium curvum]
MMIDLLIAELIRDEGMRASPYKDTKGILTVGVGHNLQAHPLPGEAYPMTDARIKAVLASDLKALFADLDTRLTWWRGLDEVRQRVIANMAFNLGVSGLLQFKNTLADAQRGDYIAAATGMRASLWAKQVGGRATRLSEAMQTGIMPK